MTWNCRLIQYEHGVEICEVYYDSKGDIESWTAGPVSVGGYTVEDTKGYFDLIELAFHAPVLEESEVNGKLTLMEVIK